MGQLRLLESLDLSFLQLRDADLRAIARGCRALRRVQLAGVSGLRPETLVRCVARWGALVELNVAHIDASDKNKMIRELDGARARRSSVPRDKAVVAQPLFDALAQHCGGLERLVARGNPHVDDACIDALSAQTAYLRYLDVADGPRVSAKTFFECVKRCGQLRAFISDDPECMSTCITTEGMRMRFKDFERAVPPDSPLMPPIVDDDDDDDDESCDAAGDSKKALLGSSNSPAVNKRSSGPFRKLSNIFSRT